MNNMLYIDFQRLTSGYVYLNSYVKKYCENVDSFDYLSFDESWLHKWRKVFEGGGGGACMDTKPMPVFMSVLKNGDFSNLKYDMEQVQEKRLYDYSDDILKCAGLVLDHVLPLIEDYNIFLIRYYELTEPLILLLSRLIHEKVPNSVVVVGDKTHIMDDFYRDNTDVDCFVTGMGEEPLKDIINRVSSGDVIPKSYMGEATPRPYIPEHKEIYDDGYISIRTGYSCTYRCSFCSSHVDGLHDRNRSIAVDDVVNTLSYLNDRYDINGIKVCDSLFYTEKGELIRFADKIEEMGLNDLYMTYINIRTSVALQYPELYTRINASFRVGMEHLNDEILKSMNKGCTGKDNMRLIKHFIDNNRELYGNFIYGYPGETKNVFDDCYKRLTVLHSMKGFIVNMNRFRMRKGSPIYMKPEKYGVEFIHNTIVPDYFGLGLRSYVDGYKDDTLDYKDSIIRESSNVTGKMNYPPIADADISYRFGDNIKLYRG